MADTTHTPRYALSFTSGALLMREALVAAPIYLREHDWSKVRALIEQDNLLQARTQSSNSRRAREVTQCDERLADLEGERVSPAEPVAPSLEDRNRPGGIAAGDVHLRDLPVGDLPVAHRVDPRLGSLVELVRSVEGRERSDPELVRDCRTGLHLEHPCHRWRMRS